MNPRLQWLIEIRNRLDRFPIDLVQLAIMPMFLFSGTFYPISAYPAGLQVVVECTPLYRGDHNAVAALSADVKIPNINRPFLLLKLGKFGQITANAVFAGVGLRLKFLGLKAAHEPLAGAVGLAFQLDRGAVWHLQRP